MVKSKFCALNDLTEAEIISKGECPYDQGGYFIVNGGEKVVVAQEKMACNFVYVFHNKPQSLYTWEVEIRSQQNRSNKPASKLSIKLSKESQNQSYTLGSEDQSSAQQML